MVRMSKQGERRALSPRRPTLSGEKTGKKRTSFKDGYRVHQNAVEGAHASAVFIPKIKTVR